MQVAITNTMAGKFCFVVIFVVITCRIPRPHILFFTLFISLCTWLCIVFAWRVTFLSPGLFAKTRSSRWFLNKCNVPYFFNTTELIWNMSCQCQVMILAWRQLLKMTFWDQLILIYYLKNLGKKILWSLNHCRNSTRSYSNKKLPIPQHSIETADH